MSDAKQYIALAVVQVLGFTGAGLVLSAVLAQDEGAAAQAELDDSIVKQVAAFATDATWAVLNADAAAYVQSEPVRQDALRQLVAAQLRAYLAGDEGVEPQVAPSERAQAFDFIAERMSVAMAQGQWRADDIEQLQIQAGKLNAAQRRELLERYHAALQSGALAPDMLPPPL